MNLDEAQTFVEMNTRPITETNKFSRCVDGRYTDIADCPMGAKPGGDVGDVVAAFGALNLLDVTLPNETVLDLVVTLIGGAEHFNFHTDDHAEPTEVGLGCGHFKQAKIDPTAYGVTQEQMDFIGSQLPSLLEKGAHQEVLHGVHAEQAVVVVDSETHGVLPLVRVGEKLHEAFIYHKTLHTAQLDRLAQLLQEAILATGKVIEEQDVRIALQDAFGKQLGETLKRLAGGLPVFTAMIGSDGTVSIAS